MSAGSLTVDEYMILTPEHRARIDAWCLLHWIEPSDTRAMRWTGERVVAEQYARGTNGRHFVKAHRVASITRGAPQCAPFPAP